MQGRARVEEWVRSRNLSWRVLEMPVSTRTVDDAARALGVGRDAIVKTLIVVCRGGVLAVIIPGDRRLDLGKLRVVDRDCRLAKPEEIPVLTGYPAGGVPPVALPEDIRIVMDRSLLEKNVVYGGGGSESTLLEFSPRELAALANVVLLDVSR